MNDFHQRVAIVTGASSGIGRATAVELAGRGARVALFARRGEELQAAARECGASALAVAGDVTSESDIDRLFTEVEKNFGACELLVNCAGMIDPVSLVEMSRQRWERMFAVNVTGAFLTARRALPAMVASGTGSIVNVASISGVIGTQKFGGFVAYAAAKAALIAMTEALAAEVRQSGVRVNSVSPGSVDTAMLKQANPALLPDMTPQEVARTIAFLCSTDARPINGQDIHVYSA